MSFGFEPFISSTNGQPSPSSLPSGVYMMLAQNVMRTHDRTFWKIYLKFKAALGVNKCLKQIKLHDSMRAQPILSHHLI